MDVAALDLVVPAATALILAMIVSGAVLLYPVSRRLAELLQWQIEEKKRGARAHPSEIDRSGVEVRLSELEDQIAAVGERQQFLERLLEKGGPSTARPE
jgi:hypothetical protein